MNAQATTFRPPRIRRLATVATLLLLLFGAFGFLAGPPILRMVLVDVLEKQLHRPAAVGAIRINPYALSIEIQDLKIGDREGGETAGLDLLAVNLESSSLFRGGPVVRELRVEGPRLLLVRQADGRYNVSDLLEEWLAPSDAPPARFSISNIRISNGRFDFDDRPAGKEHRIRDINLALPFISNLPHQTEIFVEPAFSATVNDAVLSLGGRSKPFAEIRESELDVDLKRLHLPTYATYSPLPLPFQLQGGLLDLDLKLTFRNGPQQPPVLNVSGIMTLRDLDVLGTDGAPLLALQELRLPVDGADPFARQFAIGTLGLQGLTVHGRVDRQGDLNWQTLARAFQPQETNNQRAKDRASQWSLAGLGLKGGTLHWTDESAQPRIAAVVTPLEMTAGRLDSALSEPWLLNASWGLDAAPHAQAKRFELRDARIDLKERRLRLAGLSVAGLSLAFQRQADGALTGLRAPVLRPAEKAPASADEAPWSAEVDRIELADFALRLQDKSLRPAATHVIDGGHLTIDGLSTVPRTPAQLALEATLNRKGRLKTQGTVQLQPLAAELQTELRGLEVLPFQGYFGDRLNLTITRGQLSGKGRLALVMAEDGSLAGGYRGSVTLGNFHSIDKATSEDFLSWKSFHMGGLNLQLAPFRLALDELALADFFTRIVVSPEGRLNLMEIVRQDEANDSVAATPSPPAEPPSVRIDRVTLQAGTVSVTDHFIKPNYAAELTEIGGRITGLSSAAGTAADLDLRGSYDGAPVAIAGRLNPLAAEPSLDLKAEVRGVELPSLSPYSGKYAGYAIDKGKLSLFLGYKVDQGQLSAENRIFLDQLTFGEKVDSPDAIKLPVTLAVSLLKNRRGEIDVNLPISGSLKDPQFSMGGIIVQVIMNLLTKAVTAPFALLGSLFGGGAELSHVEFATGQAALTDASLKRLEALAKALEDRPGLKLEIIGRIDPERDPEGLRRLSLQRKVKAEKLAQIVRKGTEAGSVDDVVVGEKEYLPLLEEAYKKEKFPKPRNWIGMAKSLPREEMEKLMLAHAPAGPEELRELALQRAKEVAEWLAGPGKVARERLFLLPPKLAADGGGPAEAPLSRADFSLK